jgi:hypothetical protein
MRLLVAAVRHQFLGVALVLSLALFGFTRCGGPGDVAAYRQLQEQIQPADAVADPGCVTMGRTVTCSYSVPRQYCDVSAELYEELQRRGFSGWGGSTCTEVQEIDPYKRIEVVYYGSDEPGGSSLTIRVSRYSPCDRFCPKK